MHAAWSLSQQPTTTRTRWELFCWNFDCSISIHCRALPARHSSKSISFHLSHLLKSTIEWEWVRCMLICINLAWNPPGPTLGLFREGSQVETSAYSLKSRLTKRVKQMQRPPLLLRPSIITTTKYCYWAKVGRVIYRPCQTFKVFTEQNPEITQKEKRQKFQTKARNNSFWIVWLCFYKTEN